MKGQSKFIGYMLTVLFSIIVLGSITSLIYAFYRTAIEGEARVELSQIATQIKDNLIKLYEIGKDSKVQPTNYTSILISEIDLSLPDNIARLNYEVDFVTATGLYSTITAATLAGQNISGVSDTSVAKIVAKTTQEPIVKVEFDLPNLDLRIQGRVENGQSDVLKYYRHNENLTVFDTVILGESDIIIRITEIS